VRDLKNQERIFLAEIPYYIYTYCQWRTKREKYLFCNEKRGNVRGLRRIYFHAPSKPPRRDIAKTTREKKKRAFSIPDVKARHGPFFSRVNAKSKINKCDLMRRLSGRGIENGKTDSAACIVSRNSFSHC
jgi:hypothetical protein